jgi:hypothetical protein
MQRHPCALLTSNLLSAPQAEADNGLRYCRRVALKSSGRVRTEPVMYVGKRQPRFREGKGLFFKFRGFVGYLHKY